jgi:hypothetical protein
MSVGNSATRLMIHFGLDVLNKRAVAPNVEGLSTVADGKDRLLEVEGILEEKLIDGGAGWICVPAFGDSSFTKSLRVNVEEATREQNTLNAVKQPCDAVRALVQGNDDGGDTDGMKGGKVGRQRTLVVLSVAAGGFRDCDVKGHG